ncbi:ABC transporter, putative, partial [Bodo saltans]
MSKGNRKVFYPEDMPKGEEEDVLNPISFSVFSWVSPMLARGWQRFQSGSLLGNDDLMKLPRDESAIASYGMFHELYSHWKTEVAERVDRAKAIYEESRANTKKEAQIRSNEPISPGDADGGGDVPLQHMNSIGRDRVADDEDDEATKQLAAVVREAQEELQNPMKLLMIIIKANRSDMLLSAFFRLFQDGSSIASPFVLRELIKCEPEYAVFGSEGGITKWEGFVYGIVLAIIGWLMWVFTNLSQFYTNKAFARMRAAFAMAVYEKTLKLDRSQLANVGRIQQMHSSDTYKFVDLSMFISTTWSAPMVVAGALIALYFFVGYAGLLSLATMLVLMPPQAMIMQGMMSVTIAATGIADERIQAMDELCQGIRVVKFMAWEESNIATILGIRLREVSQFYNANFYRSGLITMLSATNLLVSLVVFAVAYAIGDPVSLSNVF